MECSAVDDYDNTATLSFAVIVQDTTAPVIDDSDDIIAEATSPDGAMVEYDNPSATDAVDNDVEVSCSPSSGETFALGETTVECSAVDDYDNTATLSFTVIVQDTVPPEITSLTPAQGNTTSNVKPAISADFSDTGSGIDANSAVIAVDGNVIESGFYSVSGSGISYTPYNPLVYDFHTVLVRVSDAVGNTTEVEWTFQVADIDEVAPTATQWPADGAKNAGVNIHPRLDFSEAMDESTLTDVNIKLKKYNGSAAVDASVSISTNSCDGTTIVTIIPDSPLDYDTQYYFFISDSVSDLAGNSIGDDWYAANKSAHEFTTAAEDLPVTSYDIQLNEGWNLISLPLIPDNSGIDAVLGAVSGSVDIVKHYDAETGIWSSYVPGEGGALATMEDGKGYWIFMNTAAVLTVNGGETPDGGGEPVNYPVLENEWNLIGFKSVSDMKAEDYIRDYTDKTLDNDSILWNYKNGSYPSEPLHASDNLEPGYGYWLLIK